MRVGEVEASIAHSFWRQRAVVAGALEAVAVALWLIPASVRIVYWPPTGPQRLALFLPLTPLLWGSAAALTLSIVLTLRRRPEKHLARLSSFAAPLWLLWLWAVPYLPWLPDRLPLLLILAGPIRWAIAGAAALVALLRIRGLREFLLRPLSLRRRAIFALSLTGFLALGLNSVSSIGLRGDEPHYLIIAESLLKDGDIQIENNHQRGDYRSFVRGGEMLPDYLQRGRNGQIYSIHAFGLPALLLPVYAVAGYLGAVAFLCLMGALAALAIFDLAAAVAGRQAAVLTWMAVCLTVPFLPYSWLIFPEMPGALIVAWAALWVWQPPTDKTSTWARRGLVLAALPWLHTKFVIFSVLFGGALALRLWRRPRSALALLAPVGLSGVLWLYSFHVIYGVFDPQRPYGGTVRAYLQTSNIPHGLIGLFVDAKFGLLVYSPIYLTALAGAWLMLRRRDLRFLGAVLLLVVAAFVGSTARFYMFWGGFSAPARFLVPILPCLAPMIAVAIATARSGAARGLVGLWLIVSVAIAFVGIASPERLMLFSDPHGRARVLEAIQGPSPLALLVPTFTDPDWAAQVPRLDVWLAATAVALASVIVASRHRAFDNSWGLAGIGSMAFLVVGAMATASPADSVRNETVRRAAVELLWRYDSSRLRAIDYRTFSQATADALHKATTLVVRPPSVAKTEAGYAVAGSLGLPPGAYDAVVWFGTTRPRHGEVLVADPPGATFARASGALENPTIVSFELPVAVLPLTVRVPDPAIAKAIAEIQIVPRAVPPPSAREPLPVSAIDSLADYDRAYLVYTDLHAFPEGGVFWTRGTEKTRVVVASRGASRLVLTLSTGPMSGDVTVTAAGGKPVMVRVASGEAKELSFDVDPGSRLVPITVQSTVRFYPADADPSSRDMRQLGCHVRVALK